jgi:glutaredoxin
MILFVPSQAFFSRTLCVPSVRASAVALFRWLRRCLIALVLGASAVAWAGEATLIEMWSRDGCPYCAEARVFLLELQHRRPGVEIVVYDIVRDPAARQRFLALSESNGVGRPGVPSFLVGNSFLVGWDGAPTERLLESLLAMGSSPKAEDQAVHSRLFGTLDSRELGLPLFTAVLGLLDGFNPCAMWVLLFVLSLLVNIRNRGRVFLIGGAFVLASGLVYFAFMAAWLNVFLLIGVSRTTQIALGLIAALVGIVNVKDFLAFGRGISFSIPDSAKPALYARVRGVLQAENVAGTLAGVILLALMVNTVELLCTSGLPAVYTQVLASHELATWRYYGYLALYNLFYMLDDSILLATVVVTLRLTKLQETGGRVLKLVSGIVMIFLGVALMLRPGWLEWGGFRP